MMQFQLGNDEYVDILGAGAVLEVQRDCFFDICVKLVDGLALRENVCADSSGAPEFAVVIDLDFHKHRWNLVDRCYRFPSRFATSRPQGVNCLGLENSTPRRFGPGLRGRWSILAPSRNRGGSARSTFASTA